MKPHQVEFGVRERESEITRVQSFQIVCYRVGGDRYAHYGTVTETYILAREREDRSPITTLRGIRSIDTLSHRRFASARCSPFPSGKEVTLLNRRVYRNKTRRRHQLRDPSLIYRRSIGSLI